MLSAFRWAFALFFGLLVGFVVFACFMYATFSIEGMRFPILNWAAAILLPVSSAGAGSWFSLRATRPQGPDHESDRARHCPHCRYDLTGNVSGVCPECGTPVADGTKDAAAEAGVAATGVGGGKPDARTKEGDVERAPAHPLTASPHRPFGQRCHNEEKRKETR